MIYTKIKSYLTSIIIQKIQNITMPILKYEDHRSVLFNRSYMRHEMNRSK